MPETETKDMLSKMLKRSFGAIKPVSEHRYSPDEELCRIIEKMMKMDLKARYQTVDEVVTDLKRFQATQAPAAPAAPLFSTPPTGESDPMVDLESIYTPSNETQPKPVPESQPADAAPAADGLESFEIKAIVPKSVLCVESQAEIQDVMRKNLSSMGYRVMLVGDAERAAERYRESPVDAVIFDTDGQGAESIEAFVDMHEKAQEDGHQLVALVVLGPKQEALREKLPSGDRLIILKKPIKMKQVQDAIQELLPLS
jgi:CheY-like chemotaxis protein